MSASIMSNSLQSRFNPCGYGSNWSAPSKWTVDTKKGKNCGFICAPILDPFAYSGFWTRGPKPLKMSNFHGPGGYPIWRDNQKIPKRVCLQTHLYIYIFIHLSQTLQKSPLKLHRWSNRRFCPCGVAPLRCNVWWSRCQLNAWWKMCFPVECEGSWWLLFFWIWTWCFLGIGSCFVQFGQGDFWMFSWA